MSGPAALHEDRQLLPAGALAAVVHVAFLALMLFGVQWQNHPLPPVQAELWNSLPPLDVRPEPAPAVVPEPAPSPPTPPTPPTPPAAEPAPAAAPTPAKPSIAIERAPRKPPPVPPKAAAAPPRHDAEDLARREADLRRLDREARAKAAREQSEQARRDQAEEQRLAALQRDADATQTAQADAARAHLMQSYIDRITAKIKENTLVPASVPSGVSLTIKFVVLPDGSVLDGSIRVVKSSGQSSYDDAVQRAIIAAQPLPMPDDPALRRQMRDVTLHTNNVR